MGSVQTNIGYGIDNATYTTSTAGVSYYLADESVGNIVNANPINSLISLVSQECTRRAASYVDLNYLNVVAGGSINLSTLNSLISALETRGHSGVIYAIAAGATITANNFNLLIDKVQAAGAVCLCNCNYCTCNCNYCTCDCDYCTCNCNYS